MDRTERSSVPKYLRASFISSWWSPLKELCTTLLTVDSVRPMPQMYMMMPSTSMTHRNDFSEPRMEKIIMRSSLKVFVAVRSIRTRRTTRSMRIMRSRSAYPAMSGFEDLISSTGSSTTMMLTVTTSKKFQPRSLVRKKVTKPSMCQRRTSSIRKTTQKEMWKTPKIGCTSSSGGSPRISRTSFALAIHWTWKPMKAVFSRMMAMLNSSNSLLVTIFSSLVSYSSASLRPWCVR
mmetsp:Transcript_88384/g.227906  ORF Transcript_88384/g.227906 Transcript_88384/m.227906 type:complete len:234 (+) Transcript_88384:500-1201(+)